MSNADGLTSLPFLFFSIPIVNYKNTIFPVILGVWVFSLIFKLIDKHIHKNVRIVFSGFLTFLVAGPVILAFVTPLGNWIGVGMAAFFSRLRGLLPAPSSAASSRLRSSLVSRDGLWSSSTT